MRTIKMLAAALVLPGCVAATEPTKQTVDFGAETLSLINSHRASRGRQPVASHPLLKKMASQHSVYQRSRNRIGHDGFRQRAAQAKAAGLSMRCTENVAVAHDALHLLSQWRNSPAHNANLLRPNLRYAGVSVVGSYATFFACG